MAIKKSETVPDAESVVEGLAIGIEETNEESEALAQEAAAKIEVPEKPTDGTPDGFCVYIGPSIRGIIQSGTVYPGSHEQTVAFLTPAIEKYPLIAQLIVTDKTFAEDRIKAKTAGNLLNVTYKKLASGHKIV